MLLSQFSNEVNVIEARQANNEMVGAVWLYSLYTTILASVQGTIPGGILGIASFGSGMSVSR